MDENTDIVTHANTLDELRKEIESAISGRGHVALVSMDTGYWEMVIVFTEGNPGSEPKDHFDFRRERPIGSSIRIRKVGYSFTEILQAASQWWPQAHLVFSPCGCCCGFEDFRAAYPNNVEARRAA